MFLESIFLCIFSIFCSYLVFPKEYISLGILIFITIGAMPLFTKLFSYSSYLSNYNKSFFKRHYSLIISLVYFFLGILVSYIILFFVISTTYSLNTYTIGDVIEINSLNNYNNNNNNNNKYNLVIENIKNDSVLVSLVDKNSVLECNYFNISEYIEFYNYKLNDSFLVTNIVNNTLTLNTGNGLRESLFYTQFNEIKGINSIKGKLTGKIIAKDIKSTYSQAFNLIFLNNLGVIIKAAALSFFYGAGAIFLIAWNSSILASVISLDIFVSMAPVVSNGVIGILHGLFNSLYLFLGYLPHGLPELLAYFIISFAGAILSRDLFKGMFTSEFKWKIIIDFLFLILLAILLLLIGALIEASYFI
jgi:uncharacterized membrane protein SpoIIM required for sporulation